MSSSVVTASAASICPSAPRAAPLATKSWASRVVAKSSGSVLSSRKSKGSTPGICKDFRSVLSGGEHAGRATAIRQIANRRHKKINIVRGVSCIKCNCKMATCLIRTRLAANFTIYVLLLTYVACLGIESIFSRTSIAFAIGIYRHGQSSQFIHDLDAIAIGLFHYLIHHEAGQSGNSVRGAAQAGGADAGAQNGFNNSAGLRDVCVEFVNACAHSPDVVA